MSDEFLEIDLDSLRVREIEMIEEMMGEPGKPVPIDEAFSADKPRGKALRALGYVMKLRTDPGFTWEQAGELIIKLGKTEPDPTDAVG